MTQEPRAPRERAVVEATLRRIWSKVLDIPAEQIGPDDNFFALGGDSVLAVGVMEHVNAEFFAQCPDDALSVTQYFSNGTIRALSRKLTSAVGEPVPQTGARPVGGAIAIIGMAGRFPGAANVHELWNVVREGRETLRHFTESELLAAGVDARELARPGYVRCCGLIEGVELFDAAHFGLTPREAELTAPEQRLLFECASEALEDGGYGARWHDERVGVFVGSSLGTYLLDHFAPRSSSLETTAGMSLVIANLGAATRISYALDLRGPSVNLDTACSSSLAAVHQACRALRDGECELALAGAAAVRRFSPRGYVAETGGIVSPDGRCRPFDADANGTVFASGAGIVLLKPLEKALADGDPVYAVIAGTAINNDGSGKVGYTSPSVAGQADVIRAAHSAAGVSASGIQYVEAHGTGTSVGDAIEIAALKEAFGANGATRCALGSVKANIGHLEAAAGVAGLIKTALCLREGELPPAVNFRVPNPALQLDESPFHVNAALTRWASDGSARRAGVSSFGIGGTNVHAVMEEAPMQRQGRSHRHEQLLVLSARSASALKTVCRELAGHLRARPNVGLADVAYTLQVGRAEHPVRAYVVASDAAQAASMLEAAAATGSHVPAGHPRVAFLFPDDAADPVQMGRDLCEHEPAFRAHFDRCAQLDQSRETLLFAAEYSLARLWMSWGVVPETSVGHGVGEYVAACLAGTCSVEDAVRRVGTLAPSNPPSPADRIVEISPRAISSSAAMLNALGRLWQAGVPVNWIAFNADNASNRVNLPTYPYERTRYWVEALPAPERRTEEANPHSLDRLFHIPTWKQAPRMGRVHATSRICLLFERESDFADTLSSQLEKRGCRVIRVRSATRAMRAGNHYELDLADSSGYSWLLSDLEVKGLIPDLVLYAWRDSGICSVLDLCRALESHTPRATMPITLLTSEAYSVLGNESLRAEGGMLSGLAAGLSSEPANTFLRCIDVVVPLADAPEREPFFAELADEALHPGDERVIAFRGTRRWARVFERLAPPEIPEGTSLLRDRGVYLLTGGLGGIGLAFAEWLAARVKARLILTGRSAFPAREAWAGWLTDHGPDDATSRAIERIRVMEAAGAQVLILSADVTNAAQMHEAIAVARRTFGEINGVIHAAGVAGSGGEVSLKTHEEVNRVLAPKVQGTLILNEAVKPLAPDFFICCASLAGLIGLRGHFEYAAANSFLDAFCYAHDRTSGTRYISIDWDAWHDVGFARRGAAEERSVHEISVQQGCAAFERILANPLPQWIVSTHDLSRSAHRRRRMAPGPASQPTPAAKPADHGPVSSAQTERALRDIWRDLLGVDAESGSDSFFDLGGDSLLAVQLGTQVQSCFGRTLSLQQIMSRPTLAAMAELLASEAEHVD
jgi:acyl transferase domain-containing protein/acyl carrier protein